MTLQRPGLKGFEKVAATIKPDPNKRLAISDPDTRGLYLRVTPTGAKSWTVVARNPDGKQVWAVIGDYDSHTLAEARAFARAGVKRIKSGEVAFPKVEKPKVLTFGAVQENFIKRYVDKKALRSAPETKRIFDKYVIPRLGQKPFVDVDRDDVNALLDDIEDGKLGDRGGGPVMADRVLAALSKLFAWHVTRNKKYTSPIVRGMGRADKPNRKRVLSDDEIRLFWAVANDTGTFGRFLQICLLTGQRRAKVMAMRWDDMADSIWTIAPEERIVEGTDDEKEVKRKLRSAEREKSNAGTLKLSPLALDIIGPKPEPLTNPYVFAGRGETHLDPGSKLKKAFDAKLAAANGDKTIPSWTIHDLRRTAKTRMAKAGVRPDVSERVLGHTINGVEGIYDHHDYDSEKADALERLAAQVERIINPPADNVVEFPASAVS